MNDTPRDRLEMLRPFTARVPVPPIPDGYRLRTLEAGEEPAHAGLFGQVFDTSRLGEVPAKILPGGFYVVEHLASRQLVASCLAFRGNRPPRQHNAGQLAWLVVDPAHGRRSLGTLVAATVTNHLASEGYACPFLRTEDHRTAAIAIYLRLGWQPSLHADDMAGRWQQVLATLSRVSR